MHHSYLTVVIPAYNEAARIGATLQRILAYFDSQPWDGDVIVVLDGGRDRTGRRGAPREWSRPARGRDP